MASSSSLGGRILEVFRLVNRSMTSASPTTEQASSGQIGQPAATMIENKKKSPARGLQMRGDYPPSAADVPICFACQPRPTTSVDNFVANPPDTPPRASFHGPRAGSTEF